MRPVFNRFPNWKSGGIQLLSRVNFSPSHHSFYSFGYFKFPPPSLHQKQNCSSIALIMKLNQLRFLRHWYLPQQSYIAALDLLAQYGVIGLINQMKRTTSLFSKQDSAKNRPTTASTQNAMITVAPILSQPSPRERVSMAMNTPNCRNCPSVIATRWQEGRT
ncbi:hypothetical protein EJ08DRAFT_45176 [Tothia fuscella]|uniref:Uncharacterized protein n=1 Tax=Tothia fuscella TaxID=1048955 RepID=A0A9P4NFU8_9PEZI|nr:hypothetical protein EJ08DRAFT_45176 [Tothia fuscella]